MSLTNDDLKKIEFVINARADSQDAKFERQFIDLESTMVTKADLAAMEKRLTDKIDAVRDLHTEDHVALAEEVAPLKKLPSRLRILEKTRQ